MSAAQEFPLTAPEPRELVPAAVTPTDLLRIAVSQNVDIDKLKQLMDLQERWEKNEARKAYVRAMNEFKASPPLIEKNKHVKFGTTEYDHATLDHVCDVVTKELSKHGITHNWKVQQDEKLITVTCVLTHEMGHSEETRMMGPSDTSGSKNAVQAIGATITYLERYTLLAATGLAAANKDTDAASTMGDLTEKLEWLESASAEELAAKFSEFYKAAKTAKDVVACQALVKAKDKRKKELGL